MQLRPEEFSFIFTRLSNLLTSTACRSDLLQASAVTGKCSGRPNKRLVGLRILVHEQSYLNRGHRIQHVKIVMKSHMVNPYYWAEQLSATNMLHVPAFQLAPALEPHCNAHKPIFSNRLSSSPINFIFSTSQQGSFYFQKFLHKLHWDPYLPIKEARFLWQEVETNPGNSILESSHISKFKILF